MKKEYNEKRVPWKKSTVKKEYNEKRVHWKKRTVNKENNESWVQENGVQVKRVPWKMSTMKFEYSKNEYNEIWVHVKILIHVQWHQRKRG